VTLLREGFFKLSQTVLLLRAKDEYLLDLNIQKVISRMIEDDSKREYFISEEGSCLNTPKTRILPFNFSINCLLFSSAGAERSCT